MSTLLRKVIFWFRLVKNISKLLNPDQPQHWQNELDLKDLARGRWLRYKEIAAPQYSVGLDKDTEALLEQKLIYDITHFKRKLTGKEEIELTNKMIEICKKAEIEGKKVRDLL
jgi:hypothetical protein